MAFQIADTLEQLDAHCRPIVDWRGLHVAIERELKRVEKLRESVSMEGSQSGLMMAAGLSGYADGMKEVAARIKDRILDGGYA